MILKHYTEPDAHIQERYNKTLCNQYVHRQELAKDEKELDCPRCILKLTMIRLEQGSI